MRMGKLLYCRGLMQGGCIWTGMTPAGEASGLAWAILRLDMGLDQSYTHKKTRKWVDRFWGYFYIGFAD